MKKILLLTTSLLFALFINAQVSKTVNVETAGTLRTLLTTAEMTTVTNLTVTGSIDARDFKFMRDGITNLAILDIGEVTIQAYVGTGGTNISNNGTSISYPENEIPQYSFYNDYTSSILKRTTLKNIIFPSTITSIGNWTFSHCEGLTSITIPNSVTSIGYATFYNCSSLTNITISNSITTIGGMAFSYCESLTSLTIPNSVNSIEVGTFTGCSSLTNITIPNSITTIGESAFSYCENLTSLTIPNSVTSSIGYAAFANCSRLTSVIIGDSVKSIGGSVFKTCSKLTNVTIGNCVNSIGSSTFEDCSSLTSVTIGESLRSIGNKAFQNCSRLAAIYINSITPPTIETGAFQAVNIYACTLYVPSDSKNDYQTAPIWGDFNIVEMSPTALLTLASESAKIYPNPVTDGFYIDGLDAVSSLTLTDLGGKTVLTKHVMANEYVNVNFLPKGVYIARITTTKGLIEKKIIKD